MELLSSEEAGALLKIEPLTLATWRFQKKGPPYYKLGGLVRYDKAALIKWVEEQLHLPEKKD